MKAQLNNIVKSQKRVHCIIYGEHFRSSIFGVLEQSSDSDNFYSVVTVPESGNNCSFNASQVHNIDDGAHLCVINVKIKK